PRRAPHQGPREPEAPRAPGDPLPGTEAGRGARARVRHHGEPRERAPEGAARQPPGERRTKRKERRLPTGEPRDRALVGGAACARRGAPRRIARGDARARSARQSLAWRGSRGPAAQGAPRRRARARRAAGRRVRRGAPSVRALAARSGAAQGPADRRLLPRPVLPDVGRGGEAAVEAWLPCVQACRRGCGMARRGDAPRIAAARRTFRSGGPDRFVSDATIRLGLRENLAQFSLLLVVNAFVGAMVGLERSILPAI